MERRQQYDSIERILQTVKEKLKGEERLAGIFENCYTNTLDRTIKRMPDGTAYVVTGDIPAMWLRDSAAQMRPYLIAAKEEPELLNILAGLSRRQFFYIGIDPYANAFNETDNGNCWSVDDTERNRWVWERKYEVDSLCYPLQFAYLLWKNTGFMEHLDGTFREGAKKIVEVFKREQNHEETSEYRFTRKDTYYTDTLSRDGKGALVKPKTGMTWSGFRPSDDACAYGYLIPANMFASVVLGYVEEIAEEVYKDAELKADAARLRREIYEGIESYGIVKTEEFGEVYAYEADGYGQYSLMDDANVPSLLSMKYLGYEGKDEKVAENTRRLILSRANPYYYEGSKAAGIGSPHTPVNYIWHIALAMEGLTCESAEAKLETLHMLAKTDGGTGLMHEGFHADDDRKFTREWFSWANAMFCELVLDYCGYRVRK